MKPELSTSDLGQRLREADSEELLELVREHVTELQVPEVRQIMRNPYLTREVIEIVADQRSLLSAYEVRREIATHRATPETLALRLVTGLYWRDLMTLGTDTRVRPTVRRAADRRLGERLSGLAIGEKMAIARRAGPGVLSRLRTDPSPRVMGAILQNPRLTPGVLLPVVTNDDTPGPVLEMIARNRRWGVRYPIRVALAKNPSTPPQAALRILPQLKKRDLKGVAGDVRIATVVRRRAGLLLGEGP